MNMSLRSVRAAGKLACLHVRQSTLCAANQILQNRSNSTSSNDESSTAASSSAPSKTTTNHDDSVNHNMTQRAGTSTSSTPPPRSSPTHSNQLRKSIADHLDFSAPPAPRTHKGVHSSRLRQTGQTPAEKEMFDKTIGEILRDLEPGGGFPSMSVSRLLGGYGYPAGTQGGEGRGGGGGGLAFGARGENLFGEDIWSKRADQRRRLLEPQENDLELSAELDALKEEMYVFQTDVELLDWARRRVFVPIPTPVVPAGADSTGTESEVLSGSSSAPAANGTAPESDTNESADSTTIDTITFPSTYPYILSHLLYTLRTKYNNPHLALALFQHAQTHSIESYLSGCLAPSYNEILHIRWESFRDLEGVDETVREMGMNGVGWDRNTQKIVGKVVEDVGRDVLARGEGRWGEGVHAVLGRLEKRVQRDVKEQEYIFSYKHRERQRERNPAWGGRSGGGRDDRYGRGRESDRERYADRDEDGAWY